MSMHKLNMDEKGKAVLANLIGHVMIETMASPVSVICLVLNKKEIYGCALLKGLITLSHPIYGRIAEEATKHIADILMGGGIDCDESQDGDSLHLDSKAVSAAACPVLVGLVIKYRAEVEDAMASPPPPEWNPSKHIRENLMKKLGKDSAGLNQMIREAQEMADGIREGHKPTPPPNQGDKNIKMDDYLKDFGKN